MAADFESQVTRLGLAGYSGVGKSLLLSRFLKDNSNSSPSNDAADLKHHSLATQDGKVHQLVIADLSGATQHLLAGRNLYSFCSGLLMVFDVTDELSFDGAMWRLRHNLVADIPVVFVGNKCDLVDKRRISRERIQIACDEQEFEYVEVSAKERINVEIPFEKILQSALAFQDRTSAVCSS